MHIRKMLLFLSQANRTCFCNALAAAMPLEEVPRSYEQIFRTPVSDLPPPPFTEFTPGKDHAICHKCGKERRNHGLDFYFCNRCGYINFKYGKDGPGS
eukprot:g32405.t1